MMNKKIKFLVVSSAPTILKEAKLYAYSPYVDEMEIWFKFCESYRFISPSIYPYEFLSKPFKTNNIRRYQLPFLEFSSFKKGMISLFAIPYVIFQLFKAMYWANHIHFRSPGNISLIASVVQLFFPLKKKTVKYAGNWDSQSKQPISYKIQKYIYSNPFLCRNTKVLVYGKWPNQSKNIKSFFTATYHENEKEEFVERTYSSYLKFVYTGALVEGKRPLLALQIIERLQKKGIKCKLDIYGNGPLMLKLKNYIENNNLKGSVVLHGNENKEIIKQALKQSHFTILPSKSEGWPKAIAEGMFFGSIPISTKISCLEWMLDYGNRGILITPDLDTATEEIYNVIKSGNLSEMSRKAQSWSQKYTVERQAAEINKILMA